MGRTKGKLSKDEIEEIENWERDRAKFNVAKSLATSKIEIKCKSQSQKLVLDAIEEKIISIIVGPPGTGKTAIAKIIGKIYSKRACSDV